MTSSAFSTAWREEIARAFRPAVPMGRWKCRRPDCDGRPHQGAPGDHAREKQRLPEGSWFVWLLLLGRGWGKTRTGAESLVELMLTNPRTASGRPTEWLIAGKTWPETVANCLEGDSGLFWVLRSLGITWSTNWQQKVITLQGGQRIHITHGEDDDLGRGKNLAGAWVDEVGTWRRRVRRAFVEGLIPALRALLPDGQRPRLIITTTPKVESADAFGVLKEYVQRAEGGDDSVRLTRGTTFENSHNLSPDTLDQWRRDYPVGSRAYRQELLGELVEGVEGAMLSLETIEAFRHKGEAPGMVRKLVCLDPAVSSGENSDLSGLILLGVGEGREPDFYVLGDRSGRHHVSDRYRIAVQWAAEEEAEILVEVDQGGDTHKHSLIDAADRLGLPRPRIHEVRASGKGSKSMRAQHSVALYEEGRVHHVGYLPELEQQWTTWVPTSNDSPDRIDAEVHGLRLLDRSRRSTGVKAYSAL